MTTKPPGRPRVHPPGVTDSERTSLARQAVISAGGRAVNMILTPEVNQAMARVIACTGESMTALIGRLLVEEDQRIGEKP
ncbi:MAG: hypothetical protein KAY21_11005 [Limnohabitans sp.]|nr:hypothetical protein [Limnohabitans sp.]